MKQLIQNTRYLLKSNVIQSNYKYNETMVKLIFDDGPVLEFSKFSAPTIAFLAFWLAKKLRLWAISIYTLSDLSVLSNLIGSLSLANEHFSPPTEWIMRKPNKNKMAGVNAWIERSVKSIFNGFLLKMSLRSLPVYILKQLFFSISVNIVAEYLPCRFVAR